MFVKDTYQQSAIHLISLPLQDSISWAVVMQDLLQMLPVVLDVGQKKMFKTL